MRDGVALCTVVASGMRLGNPPFALTWAAAPSTIPSSGETVSTPGITAKVVVRTCLTILAVMPGVDIVSPDEGITIAAPPSFVLVVS